MIRRLAALVSALALTLTTASSAASPTFVWKATSPSGAVVYLGGSVHLLSADFYPLPAAYDEAFNASDLLVEELDMGEMLAPGTQMQMLSKGMLPPGQTLDRTLKPETISEVSAAVTAMGLPIEPLKMFKPWMLAITLQSMAWQKAGFDANLGLDKHFYDRAKQGGKTVKGLETLDYQLSRFDGLPADAQERMLLETVRELDKTKDEFTRLVSAWKSGNIADVEKQVLDDLKNEPEMNARLLVERNRTWLPIIEALFARPKPAFVVVGAAHLVGSDGLVALLRSKGYTVTQQ